MTNKHYTIEKLAMHKAACHILKHSNQDCIGVLLGNYSNSDGIKVCDVVPLFHNRVFASPLEAAFTMIQHIYENKLQIVGVYDAPLKYKSSDNVPVTNISTNICDQIR